MRILLFQAKVAAAAAAAAVAQGGSISACPISYNVQ